MRVFAARRAVRRRFNLFLTGISSQDNPDRACGPRLASAVVPYPWVGCTVLTLKTSRIFFKRFPECVRNKRRMSSEVPQLDCRRQTRFAAAYHPLGPRRGLNGRGVNDLLGFL